MRLIDADSINWESVEEEHGARTPAVVACQSLIQNSPTIDPVRHGKWKLSYTKTGHQQKDEWYGYVFYCSECNEEVLWGKWNHCPNCGAKMDGGDAND